MKTLHEHLSEQDAWYKWFDWCRERAVEIFDEGEDCRIDQAYQIAAEDGVNPKDPEAIIDILADILTEVTPIPDYQEED